MIAPEHAACSIRQRSFPMKADVVPTPTNFIQGKDRCGVVSLQRQMVVPDSVQSLSVGALVHLSTGSIGIRVCPLKRICHTVPSSAKI